MSELERARWKGRSLRVAARRLAERVSDVSRELIRAAQAIRKSLPKSGGSGGDGDGSGNGDAGKDGDELSAEEVAALRHELHQQDRQRLRQLEEQLNRLISTLNMYMYLTDTDTTECEATPVYFGDPNSSSVESTALLFLRISSSLLSS